MACGMAFNNDDQKVIIKAKMEVSIEKKKQFRSKNLKASRDLGILIDV
jgi:hypothetical protein